MNVVEQKGRLEEKREWGGVDVDGAKAEFTVAWVGTQASRMTRSSVQVCPCIFPVQKVLPFALSIFAPISLLPILVRPPENVTCMCFALCLVSTLQFPASNTCCNFTMELMILGLRHLVGFEIFHEALNFWCIDHSFLLKLLYYPGFRGAIPTRSSHCSFPVSFLAFSSFSSPRFILSPLLFSPTTLSFYTLVYCCDLELLRNFQCNLNFLTAIQTRISNCLPCPLGALQINMCRQTSSLFL